MMPDEIAQYTDQIPCPPLRLTLSSGDQFIIDDSDRPMIQGYSLVLRGRSPDARSEAGYRLVSISNIAMVERLANRPPRLTRRR